MLEFLKEKETTLHTYMVAGKLDWGRPADRIAVLDWLSTALSGNARSWWDSAVYTTDPATGQTLTHRLWESLMDWGQVKTAFKAKWERAVDVSAAHAQFHKGLAQQPSEALHDFNARFDLAAEKARVTDPSTMATVYWYGLDAKLREAMVVHVQATKGLEASKEVFNLPLAAKRDLAAEVVALQMVTRQASRLASGLPPPHSTRGGLHSYEGGFSGDVWDDYPGEEEDAYDEVNTSGGDRVIGDGAINVLNGRGGRNSNTVSVGRGSSSSKKRKPSQSPVGASGSGRNRDPSASPGAPRDRTPRAESRSPANRAPPPYNKHTAGSGAGGGRGHAVASLTPDQVQWVSELRQQWGQHLAGVSDSLVYARMTQRACLLCGDVGHRVVKCPKRPSSVKSEHPKGGAREDRQ
ncbi:MAG: hypothetical protein ACOVQL_11560 [Limnohabitans sp.]